MSYSEQFKQQFKSLNGYFSDDCLKFNIYNGIRILNGQSINIFSGTIKFHNNLIKISLFIDDGNYVKKDKMLLYENEKLFKEFLVSLVIVETIYVYNCNNEKEFSQNNNNILSYLNNNGKFNIIEHSKALVKKLKLTHDDFKFSNLDRIDLLFN